MNNTRTSTFDEKSNNVEGQATGGEPQTLSLKPIVTNGESELGNGKIVDTMHDQATGKIECETSDYESKEVEPVIE